MERGYGSIITHVQKNNMFYSLCSKEVVHFPSYLHIDMQVGVVLQ